MNVGFAFKTVVLGVKVIVPVLTLPNKKRNRE